MNANRTQRFLSASVMIAAAMPAFATDKQDLFEQRRAQQVYAHDGAWYEQRPVFRRQATERPVEVRRTVVVERPVVREVLVSRPVYVERQVVVHRPVVREVVVERPVYVERPAEVYRDAPAYPDYYPQYPVAASRDDSGSLFGMLGGAIIGAVIGSQVADPEHRTAATVAGAVIGGAIGNGF